jgi:hypothetical protein
MPKKGFKIRNITFIDKSVEGKIEFYIRKVDTFLWAKIQVSNWKGSITYFYN